jgi:hypothetical protein
MDRTIIYDAEIPQTTDLLNTGKFALVGQSYLNRAILGVATVCDGLACTPTSPTADLYVNVGVGTIYTLDQVDATAFSDLGTDTHVVMKQGILADPVRLQITPPGTPGYSQVFLVEAIIQDVDGGLAVLPYYNAANPSVPFSGPSNSGTSQYTQRTVKCAVTLKAGSAAPTGSQTTPSPDAGYVGLYAVTVTYGQTQITSGNIATLANAPFFPKLPAIPADVQTNSWTYAVDTSGAANSIIVSVNPPPASLTPGLGIFVKIANGNTGATTINVNGLGNVPVHRANGSALASGDINAGMICAMIYDGSAFQVMNFEGFTSTTTNNNTYNYFVPYATDSSGTPNSIVVSVAAIVTLSAGVSLFVKVANTTTGPTTIVINSLAAQPVIGEGGGALVARSVRAGDVILLVYDGTSFQKINKRNNLYSFDLSSPPSPNLVMVPGDQTTITFSGATSIPLDIAVSPGLYQVDLYVTTNNSTNTDVTFLPNDTLQGANAFTTTTVENSDSGNTVPPYINSNDAVSSGSNNMVEIDCFNGPQSYDTINDIGPFFLSMLCATFTGAKTIKWDTGIAGGRAFGFTNWNDTSTPWISLGTIQASRYGGWPAGTPATLSGTAVVRRLA